MPEARYAIERAALHSMLILDDAEIARVVASIESIAADPLAAAHHSRTTPRGLRIHVFRMREFEITYTFHRASNRVWIADVERIFD